MRDLADATYGTIADFTPGVSDIKAIKETAADPTPENVVLTGISFVPLFGDGARTGVRMAGGVGLDANALIDAIERKGAALVALGKRIPIVSIRAAREFATGSAEQFYEFGAAVTRRVNLQKLREFLSTRGGRIGRAADRVPPDELYYAGIRAADSEVLGSAQKEGIKVLTKDGRLQKRFPGLTENY